MFRSIRIQLGLLIFLLLLQGCTASLVTQFKESPSRPHDAVHFFNSLDKAVNDSGVKNAAYASVEGFPYLRTNRFLSAIKNDLTSKEQVTEWVEAMKSFDTSSRIKEIQNLPMDQVRLLLGSSKAKEDKARVKLIELLRQYSNDMYRIDKAQAGYFDAVSTSVSVPDEYSTAMRVFGLYPLAYLPVVYFTDNAYNKMKEWHSTPVDSLKQFGELVGYGPEPLGENSKFDFQNFFQPVNLTNLGLPKLNDLDKTRLAHYYAPVIIQDTVEEYDKIGTLEWRNNRPQLGVEQSTMYYYFTHALLGDRPILQINYSFWYSAREGERAPWIEHGNIDGITYRVSLDTSGSPFMVDVMNNCGCYQFFVPDKEKIESVVPLSLEFDALVLNWLPDEFPSKRIALRISAGWHQIENIDSNPQVTNLKPYKLTPYDELESLPGPDGQNFSAFNSEGILKNTERIEPYILFSMGVPDIGSMRQRGHHAIKLIGRAHFDDPDLFNTHFKIKPFQNNTASSRGGDNENFTE